LRDRRFLSQQPRPDAHKRSQPEYDITVFAALANGHCLVQTPTALVEVADSNTSREIFQGKAMMDWLGNMYRKHN
jgi:hypothetical protein